MSDCKTDYMLRLMEYVDRDFFIALTYLGFHLEHEVNKLQMYTKFIVFKQTLSLLAFAVCIGPFFRIFFSWVLHCSHNGRTVVYNFFSSLSTFVPLFVQWHHSSFLWWFWLTFIQPFNGSFTIHLQPSEHDTRDEGSDTWPYYILWLINELVTFSSYAMA